MDTVAASRSPGPLSDVSVEEAMTPGVISCAAETPLEEVAALMADSRVHAIAVCRVGAPAGDPRGVWAFVSDNDLLAALGAGRLSGLTAGAVAGTQLLTVRADESLGQAAALMAHHRVSHAAVVRDGVPAGILSSLDVARWVARAAGTTR